MGIMNNEMSGSINGACNSYSDLCTLAIELRELREQVKALWRKELEEQMQLPAEITEPIVEERFKKKRLGRPLMEGEIRDALSRYKTMAAAARYLGVHLDTLKKYCRLYDGQRVVGGSGDLSAGGYPRLAIGGSSDLLWRPTRGTKVKKKSI